VNSLACGSAKSITAREYQAVEGRWISPDPAGMGAVDPANPQSWNRYAHVTIWRVETCAISHIPAGTTAMAVWPDGKEGDMLWKGWQ
jgi:hypothetical protein